MAPSDPTLPTTPVHILKTHAAPINTIAFSSAGGTYVLTGSSDRQIHLSRTEPSKKDAATPTTTTQPIQKYTSHGYAVLSIAVSDDNNTFASSSADRSGPFIWDIHTADSTLRRLGSNSPSPHTSRINSVAYSANSTVLVSGSDDRSVRLWDLKSRDARPLQILEEARDGISSVTVDEARSQILSGSVDGRVRSYDVRMGKCVTDVQPGAVTNLSLSRDGRTLLVGCLDGKLRLMDRENGDCLRTFPSGKDEGDRDGYVNETLRLQSCLGGDGALALSGSESDGKVRGWDVVTGKVVGLVDVSDAGKVISVVKWREGSIAGNRSAVWGAGGSDGIIKIYA